MKKTLTILLLGMLSYTSAQQVNFNYDDKPFNNSKKQFNDWSISAFGGINLLQNSDFVSWQGGGYFEPGYDI